MNDDFRAFFALLHRHGVEFAILGGVAYNHYAPPRATKDIDVWVRPEPGNLVRLLAAVAAFGFPVDGLDAQVLAAPEGRVVMLGRVPNRIDVLTRPKGITWEAAAPRMVTARYGDVAVPILGLVDLIDAKRAAGRPQDLADVAKLERIARR